jgi:spermidine synthase
LVDVVEYDEVVYDAAAEFFSYGIRRPRSKSIMDGAKYVQRAAEARRNNPDTPRWNYVVQDCFTAGSLPVELFTRDFWNDIQDVVTEDGVVVMVSWCCWILAHNRTLQESWTAKPRAR